MSDKNRNMNNLKLQNCALAHIYSPELSVWVFASRVYPIQSSFVSLPHCCCCKLRNLSCLLPRKLFIIIKFCGDFAFCELEIGSRSLGQAFVLPQRPFGVEMQLFQIELQLFQFQQSFQQNCIQFIANFVFILLSFLCGKGFDSQLALCGYSNWISF